MIFIDKFIILKNYDLISLFIYKSLTKFSLQINKV
jgi:hypothetical protein